jgi:hypothetical protein
MTGATGRQIHPILGVGTKARHRSFVGLHPGVVIRLTHVNALRDSKPCGTPPKMNQ